MTFEVLAVLVAAVRQYGYKKHPGKNERIRNILLIAQTAVTVVAFIILFLAPGNDIRVVSEVQNWMPQYNELSFGQHFFIFFEYIYNKNTYVLASLGIFYLVV